MFEPVEQEPPIRQVGEGVVEGGPMELRLELLAHGDVLDKKDPTDEGATLVMEERQGDVGHERGSSTRRRVSSARPTPRTIASCMSDCTGPFHSSGLYRALKCVV